MPEVIRTGKARIFNDITAEALATYARDDEHLRLLTAMDARDVIIVPLAAPARTLGAITLVSSRRGRRLIEADLDIAVRLGRRAGTAVESARLYTERSRIARVLQRALLPDSLPEMPGFEVAASYRPAGELNEVGGDFYDVIPCGERAWMLVIGDVCGKGPEAASVTALARHTLRAVSMLEAAPGGDARAAAPRAPPAGARRADVHRVPGARERGRRRGERSRSRSVATPVPCWSAPARRHTRSGSPARVLGMVDPITVSETSVVLGEGQTLILFTDGVTEAARSDARGAVELAELARRSRHLPVRDMLELIERAAVAERRRPPPRRHRAARAFDLPPATLG